MWLEVAMRQFQAEVLTEASVYQLFDTSSYHHEKSTYEVALIPSVLVLQQRQTKETWM